MRQFGEREYGATLTNACDRAGYIAVPTELVMTCLYDGVWRIDSIGLNPTDKSQYEFVTAHNAYAALDLRSTERAAGWGGENLTAFPADMEVWNLNYSINSTFRAQDIGTFKEVRDQHQHKNFQFDC